MRVFLGIVTGIVVGGFFFLFAIKLYQSQYSTVPDVVGLSGTEACERLKASGLFCDTSSSETVVDAYPRTGSRVKKGRTVNLYYENPQKRTVPRLSQLNLSVAEEILKRLGWNYETVYFPFGTEKDRILATYPEEGQVYKGRLILLIDTGERESYFLVENFVGKKADELKDDPRVLLLGTGDTVVAQYPPEGSMATEVILILGEE
ncbi:PASTA domain-containing protein [Thermotoga sp. 38H-to]|uniref:PASTA domain-containing protein n=1 Tax=Thermotoga sp. 38H-to TaxID=1755812 RepID=UPI0013EB6369|nr:PASTA domain-containing protein [Thermotoga sp. 38H-to]KAF2960636.1 penicillin-binding protein [Thermotoga sp. 38H-to]